MNYGIGGTIDTLRPVGAVDEKSMAAVKKFVKVQDIKDGYKGLDMLSFSRHYRHGGN